MYVCMHVCIYGMSDDDNEYDDDDNEDGGGWTVR